MNKIEKNIQTVWLTKENLNTYINILTTKPNVKVLKTKTKKSKSENGIIYSMFTITIETTISDSDIKLERLRGSLCQN